MPGMRWCYFHTFILASKKMLSSSSTREKTEGQWKERKCLSQWAAEQRFGFPFQVFCFQLPSTTAACQVLILTSDWTSFIWNQNQMLLNAREPK